MEKQDNISNYETSLEKLISGVNKVTEIIKPTYGPSGGNVVIEESISPGHRIANDGKLITDSILLADPIEQIGANILKEVCEKQEKQSGDGRKTTVILTSAILNEGMKYKDKIQPLELKRQLDACLPIIIKSIDDQKKEIKIEDIGSIARLASESEEIGNVIGEIYPKIGREGIIEIDTSNLPNTYYEIVDGVRVRSGWFGGYWQTEEGKCVIEKPRILITKDKIVSVDQVLPLYKSLKEQGISQLVIYCEDIEMSVASRLALTSVQGSFHTLIIKAPILWKDWLYEDLAQMTGAVPVDSKIGHTFKLLKVEDLGTCDKIVTTDKETRIIGIKDVSEHIAKLKEKGLKDDQQLLRAHWLNTKVAVLKVGANSESELSWKIKKAKDACHATHYALIDGVVRGGAESLMWDIGQLPASIGGKIMMQALTMPNYQLRINQGLKELEELNMNGIIDPALVVKSAITNSISIAGIILTTKGVITIPLWLKEMMMKSNNQRIPQ